MNASEERRDVVVIGAGAAGLFAAIAARGAVRDDGGAAAPPSDAPDVLVLEASERLGLKILASGGGRCNVTNERVDERDFETDAPHLLRGYLAGFDVEATRKFFESRGCPLYAEPLGKLFPRTDDARDVLRTLLDAATAAGAEIRTPADVVAVERDGDEWRVRTADGSVVVARRVIVAAGGKSLPKTGSRGFGYDLATRLGFELEPPLPALTPLLFGETSPLRGLSGVTLPAILTLAPRAATAEQGAGAKFRPLARAAGSLLMTHGGASGPAALDVSGPAAAALARKEDVVLRLDVWTLARRTGPWGPFLEEPKAPGCSLPPAEAPRPPTFDAFVAEARKEAFSGYRKLANAFSPAVPRSVAEALLKARGLDLERPARTATLLDWRAAHEALCWADVKLEGVDGYGKAEVTRGGVRLGDLRRGSLEGKTTPGLHWCGEVVNVTGRLGGFNFQWAWSSGFAAGRAAANRQA